MDKITRMGSQRGLEGRESMAADNGYPPWGGKRKRQRGDSGGMEKAFTTAQVKQRKEENADRSLKCDLRVGECEQRRENRNREDTSGVFIDKQTIHKSEGQE